MTNCAILALMQPPLSVSSRAFCLTYRTVFGYPTQATARVGYHPENIQHLDI